MLPVAIAWSFYRVIAIRYVLSVLWMMSCLHIIARNMRCDRRIDSM